MTQLVSAVEWPPSYKLKKHRKARHVKLRTSKSDGLIITIPFRFNVRELPTILEKNKNWIIQQLQCLRSLQSDELPNEIVLSALQETWSIHYTACHAKFEMIERPGRELVLVGRLPDIKTCQQKLIAWIKQYATKHLVSHLQCLSQKTQLNYANVIIRDQQTRWGSCTSRKSISLNYKLLFLPKDLMQHVLIHELCHTKYLNHSEKFWQLVGVHDPHWQEHRRELRRAEQYIPSWVDIFTSFQ